MAEKGFFGATQSEVNRMKREVFKDQGRKVSVQKRKKSRKKR